MVAVIGTLAFIVIFFVLTASNKYGKDTKNVLVGSGIGCTVVLAEFAIGIIGCVIIISIVRSCGG